MNRWYCAYVHAPDAARACEELTRDGHTPESVASLGYILIATPCHQAAPHSAERLYRLLPVGKPPQTLSADAAEAFLATVRAYRATASPADTETPDERPIAGFARTALANLLRGQFEHVTVTPGRGSTSGPRRSGLTAYRALRRTQRAGA